MMPGAPTYASTQPRLPQWHGRPSSTSVVWPHSPALLDAGYAYMGNGLADDIPYYWVTDVQTQRPLLTLPYYYHFDDQFFLMFPPPGLGSGLENPKPFLTNCLLEFDALYKRGRYFSMVLHPHIIGHRSRLGVLRELLHRCPAPHGAHVFGDLAHRPLGVGRHLLRLQHDRPRPQEQRRIWEVRESSLAATAHVPGAPLTWEGWEDGAVAPEKLGGYLREPGPQERARILRLFAALDAGQQHDDEGASRSDPGSISLPSKRPRPV